MKFLAIDPGIDVVAAALFDEQLAGADASEMVRAARAFQGVVSISTSTKDSRSYRCFNIAHAIAHMVEEHRLSRVYLEMPPTWHVKTMDKLRARRVIEARDKLQNSIGAIAAGAGMAGATVIEVPADSSRKESRKRLVNIALRRVGKDELTNADQIDATWIGFLVLMNGALRRAG